MGRLQLVRWPVFAGDGIRLTSVDGHWTLWHPRCAVKAAVELHEAGTRAMAGGGTVAEAPL